MIADLSTALEPVTRDQGLTMTQLRFLCEIKIRQPITVGMLSSIVGENKGNCSSMCKKLENAGYLIRRRCPQDERRVELQLTVQGEELLRRISEKTEKNTPVSAMKFPRRRWTPSSQECAG